MVKRCLIPDCSLEGDFSEFFRFPKDLKLLDQWISKLPLLNFSSLNFKEVVICEHHFNPKEVIEGLGFHKELAKNAVPEYFPAPDPIDSESCRFCLMEIRAEKFAMDEMLMFHYQNLVQEEFPISQSQKFSCQSCYLAIRNSSFVKTKVQENQKRLHSFQQRGLESEFLEIKMELFLTDEEEEIKKTMEFEGSENQEVEEPAIRIKPGMNPVEKEKEYCELCDQSFLSLYKHRLRQHRNEHDRQKESEKLDRFGTKKKTRIRKKESRKWCEICQKDFTNLLRHKRRIHLKIKNFECDFCGVKIFAKSHVENHMVIHQKYRELFTCEICRKEFATKSSYRSHLNKNHLKKGLIFCEFCGHSCQSSHNYQAHVRSKHTGERPFLCDQCPPDKSMSFSIPSDLRRHKAQVHSTETATCSVCGIVVKSAINLRNHMRLRHREKTFVCGFENCPKSFSTNYQLKFHTNSIHLGVRNFECRTCGSKHLNRRHLERHILSVHMNFRFPCEVWDCKSEFKRKETYREHVLNHHKELGEEFVQNLLEKIRKLEFPKIDL